MCSPLDLESSSLQASNVERQRRRRISTGEDVLVQVQSPDEILILPRFSESRELDIHGSIILQEAVALAEKGSQSSNADVLGHLQLRNLVKPGLGDITIVAAQDPALVLGHASLLQRVVAPFRLVASQSNTGDLGAVVDARKLGEGAPSAANVEHGVALLESNLLADDGHLVVLHLLERLLAGRVRDDARSVNHARAEEPRVMVVAAVVVGTHLVLVLRARVEEHRGAKVEEDGLEQVEGEAKGGPVVTVLHDLEGVAVEVDLALDVLFVKRLHRDLVAPAVLGPVRLALEGEVVARGTAGDFDLVVEARAVRRHDLPDDHQHGDGGEDAQEDGRLGTAPKPRRKIPRRDNHGRRHGEVGELLIARPISGQRSILNCGRLLRCELNQ